MEWSLELTRRAGSPDRAAAYFGDMLGRFVDASVPEVTARGGPDPEAVGAYFRGLPPDRFPNIVRLTGDMFEGTDEDRFEFGLELLVRGLAAHAEEAKAKNVSARRAKAPRGAGCRSRAST